MNAKLCGILIGMLLFATFFTVAGTINDYEGYSNPKRNDNFSMTIQDAQGSPGEEIVMPITGEWNASFWQAHIVIEFNNSIVGFTGASIEGTVFTDDWYVNYGGSLHLKAISIFPKPSAQQPISPGEGTLLNVQFQIQETVPDGPTEINLVDEYNSFITAYFPYRDSIDDPYIPDLNNGTLTIISNEPPETPQAPNGPTEGEVDVTYTYNTSTIDPEGHDIYYNFSWGDGTHSGWLGPYSSGSVAEANHAWHLVGTYDVVVKAKDLYEESNWSDPLEVTIVELLPELSIESVEGGKGITVVIKNVGDANATNVQWNITIAGGLFFWKPTETSGNITVIAINDSETITMNVGGIGLGILTEMPTITAYVGCDEDSSDEYSVSAKILGPFVLI